MDWFSSLRKIYAQSFLAGVFSEFSGIIGSMLIVSMIILAIFAPQIAPYSPTDLSVRNQLKPPSLSHLMGTDEYGRDLFSRVIFGSRIAFIVSLPSVGLGLLIGIILGTLAGFSSGYIDNIIIFIFDVIRSFPALLFAITVLTLLGGTNLLAFVIVIATTRFPGYGRLIRAQANKVSGNEYVEAAQATGASTARILVHHIIPNGIGPAFVQAAMDIPVVIMYEAALSFLGLGLPPPTPSWGTILRGGYSYIRIAPWIVIFGSLMLVAASLGFTLFGEVLRDVLDPKLRETSKL